MRRVEDAFAQTKGRSREGAPFRRPAHPMAETGPDSCSFRAARFDWHGSSRRRDRSGESSHRTDRVAGVSDMRHRHWTYLILPFLAACQSERTAAPTGPVSTGGPLFEISDGAHGGNPDLFFLPPTVPNPKAERSKFYPDLDPVVTIRP